MRKELGIEEHPEGEELARYLYLLPQIILQFNQIQKNNQFLESKLTEFEAENDYLRNSYTLQKEKLRKLVNE